MISKTNASGLSNAQKQALDNAAKAANRYREELPLQFCQSRFCSSSVRFEISPTCLLLAQG